MARWHLYTPLSASELEKVEAEYQQALARASEARPGSTASVGALAPAPGVPRAAEVTVAFRAADKPAPPLVLARLKGCKRGLTVSEPAELETDRAQVSAIRFLLQRLGQGVVDWGDGQLQPTEEALKALESHLDAGNWDGSSPFAPTPMAPEKPVRNPNATTTYPRGELQGSVMAQDPAELVAESLLSLKQVSALLERLESVLDNQRSLHGTEVLRAQGELCLLRARMLDLHDKLKK